MIRRLSALFAGTLLCTFAIAQTVPNGGITLGEVWTVAQWINAWQTKADTLNPFFTGAVTINGVVLTPSFPANPTCTIGLSTVNGSATTFPRSDASCALSQSISPNWSAGHTFSPPASVRAITVNGSTNAYGISIIQQTSAGTSFGESINAGTNASDTAFTVNNALVNKNYFNIRGDGLSTFGGSVIVSPSASGVSLTALNSASGDIFVVRDSVNSFQLSQGTNSNFAYIDASNATNGLAFTTQGSSNTRMSISNSGDVAINTPSSGVALSVLGAASNITENVQANEARLRMTATSGDTYDWISGGGTILAPGTFGLFNSSTGAVAFSVNGAGGMAIPTPSSGNALTVNGTNPANALVVNGSMSFDGQVSGSCSAGANGVLFIGCDTVPLTGPTSAGSYAIKSFVDGTGVPGNAIVGEFLYNRSTSASALNFAIEMGNDTTQAVMGITSSTFSGSVGTNFPAGPAWFFNSPGYETCFTQNGTASWCQTPNRNIVINAPASGIALTATGVAGVPAVAIFSPNTASSSFGLGINAGTNSSDTALGVNNASAASLFSVKGDGSTHLTGISTTASPANAFIDSANTNNILRSTSSRRYKQDIVPLPESVAERVLDLQPIRYRSKAAADDPNLLWYGLIAEDVADVDPRLAVYDDQGRPDGVQYERVGVLLLGVVKHQQQQIHLLEFALAGVFALSLYASARRVRRLI